MSETKYTIVYVQDEANGVPGLIRDERATVHSATLAEWVLDGTHKGIIGRSEYVWVVKSGTPAHKYLCEHAAGRISSFLVSSPKDWLSKVVADPELMSCPAEDFRPAVKGYGLGSTDNGKKANDLQMTINNTINAASLDSHSVALKHMAGGIAKASMAEPTGPRTTLITQVDVHDVSPINDTLYNALEASKLEGMDGDQFPEDGNITIQWSKVHGRDRLRKFTITVDYKESN